MKSVWIASALTAVFVATAFTAQAVPTLTPAATASGFTLSVFVDEIPTFTGSGVVGPVGIMNVPSGIMISGYGAGGDVRTFSNPAPSPFPTASHHWNDYLTSVSYAGTAPAGLAAGVGPSAGRYFMVQQGSGQIREISSTGADLGLIASLPFATGIVTNPANGHLYVSNVSGIYDVNPFLNTMSLVSGADADGLSITADGKTLYAADRGTGRLIGIDTTSLAQTFDSGFISYGIDGTALGSGVIAGKIVVVLNEGVVLQVDLVTKAQVVLMTGGTRGDLAWVDQSNGTFLFTQSNEVLRLTAPPGGGFETVTGTPTPGALALFSFGVFCFGAFRRKSK